jgi:hypothetical protein
MIQNDTKKTSKNIQIFSCEFCDFTCSKRGDYNRHLTRPKHIENTKMIQNDTKKTSKNIQGYSCKCGNIYKHHSGLYRHKKICNIYEVTSEMEEDENCKIHDSFSDKELIIMLIKQNAELVKETNDFKSIMMEVIKNGTHNTTHTNSHNKSFNLQFFLNETCKNAMNITEFVDSLKLQLSDLERVGELGYIEGISSIIVKNLKEMDVTQRPVHCTDKKRETIYIKDENKWEKDEENKKMHKLVKRVADKNARLLPKFKEKYPDYNKASSRISDQYNKIIIESMGGAGDNDYEKEEKIIKKVSKEITVYKD